MKEYIIKRIEATPNWEEIPTLKIAAWSFSLR